jgi:predicted metal-binding membrane protein
LGGIVLDRIRGMTGRHWIALFALILTSWVMLYLMALPAELRAAGRIYGAEFLAGLCRVTPDAAGFARVTLMWALMSAAMMAPTALPAFTTYDDLPTRGRFGTLVAGYLAVWLGFSVLAAGLQIVLFRADLVSAFGDSRSAWLSAGLLAVAGGYQFSPLKDACLSRCRAPLTFFFQHWDEGPWRNGLRLGLVCLGCCWALMLLAFVGGVMSLAFMGVATLIMLTEKLPQAGQVMTRPLGIGLLAAAAWLAARQLGL